MKAKQRLFRQKLKQCIFNKHGLQERLKNIFQEA